MPTDCNEEFARALKSQQKVADSRHAAIESSRAPAFAGTHARSPDGETALLCLASCLADDFLRAFADDLEVVL
jgi:hypothetical protein